MSAVIVRETDRTSVRLPRPGRVAELFAGVGGFRLGLEGHATTGLPGSGWRVIWSNQWEPGTRRQHASDCYVARFGADGHVNADIAAVLDEVERGERELPQVDLVVGGFPCQDYSVARSLSQAAGLQGKKGVLWWEIHRFLNIARPRFLFLENVDRLLKSPAHQRGRDFGVILRCLASQGYLVEWRVINAADYGYPQRRRRTLIVGHRLETRERPFEDPIAHLLHDGILARALPAHLHEERESQLALGMTAPPNVTLPDDVVRLSDDFRGEFENAGVMCEGKVWTARLTPTVTPRRSVLRDVLQPEADVADEYFIPARQIEQWRYLKGAKREERIVSRNGFRYFYTEGAIAFPDPVDESSRTILTGEGGIAPSRFKHVVLTPSGRLRRLTPVELERLNGFPDRWTDTGMPTTRRAFCMGNALVVGLVERVGHELARAVARRRPEPEEMRPQRVASMSRGA